MDNSPDNRPRATPRRYRRMFALVGALALASAIVAVVALYINVGEFQLHASLAMAIGVGLSVLLGGGLMALVFLSNGTGHDARVQGGDKRG